MLMDKASKRTSKKESEQEIRKKKKYLKVQKTRKKKKGNKEEKKKIRYKTIPGQSIRFRNYVKTLEHGIRSL